MKKITIFDEYLAYLSQPRLYYSLTHPALASITAETSHVINTWNTWMVQYSLSHMRVVRLVLQTNAAVSFSSESYL